MWITLSKISILRNKTNMVYQRKYFCCYCRFKKKIFYLDWYGLKLSKNNKLLCVPKNFAHGYIILENETGIFYQSSNVYLPIHKAGINWNDPKIGIKWSIKSKIISDKYSSWKNIE
jgi:dTDP-4-dehydrorhamnose 3,5-epimerase-like enzyme